MTIEIKKISCIKDIQMPFCKEYPYLKIEFFDMPHNWGETTRKAHRYTSGYKISSIERKKHTQNWIHFNRWMKAGQVEEQLKEQFGLFTQIYRRNGYAWVETAGTDELSLDELNEIGKKSVLNYRNNLWIEREILL
jgi:hypothetical protein